MTLEEAIEQAIARSDTLRGAQRRLMNMSEADVIEDKHHYYVRPYIVRGHNRRRRHNLKLIRRAS